MSLGIVWILPMISSFLTPKKVLYLINGADEGIDINDNELHPLNAFDSIDVVEGGSIIVFNDEHSSNALSAIEVIGEIIVIFSIDEFL